MAELLPCPCGLIPERLHIQCDNRAKWGRVSCPCGDWETEFRNSYAEAGSDEMRASAERAWNSAKRKGGWE